MIVALLASKGGVSKTTLALNLAACWATKEAPVLLVDADEQEDLFFYKGAVRYAEWITADAKSLGPLLASSREQFEYVIVDCAGGLGETAQRALEWADVVVVPVPPAMNAARAWLRVSERICAMAPERRPLLLGAITLYSRASPRQREMKNELLAEPNVARAIIPSAIGIVDEAAAQSKSVVEWKTTKSSALARAYRRLAQEITDRARSHHVPS